MDKPIAVGDLVQVVRPCPYCGDSEDLGMVYTVRDLFGSDEPMTCCGIKEWDTCANGHKETEEGVPVQLLKRIPPLEELEGEKRDEKLTEPA